MKTISQSKLKSWRFCPAAFFEQYILKVDLYNPHFDYGKNEHEAIENYHLGKPYNPELIKGYTDIWKADDFDLVEHKEKIILKHPKTGKELPSMSMVFDTVKRGKLIHDYKTSEASWSQKEIDDPMSDKGLQATIYCFGWWQLTGELLPFTFTVKRKHPGPRTKPISQLTTTRTVEDFCLFHEWAQKTVKDIQSAVEYPCTCFAGTHKMVEVRLG